MHTCLVLELLGPNVPTTIDSQFADGRLPVRIAQKVAKQVLLGLAYLHSNGVGHGGAFSPNVITCTAEKCWSPFKLS
jgi:serine/threonine-protein kinase SRPK3